MPGTVDARDAYGDEGDLDARRAALRARLFICVSALATLGLVMVYSATTVRGQRLGAEWSYGYGQLQWTAIGAVGFVLIGRVPLVWYRRLAMPAAAACLAMLALVRIPGIGTKVGGAYRWFRFGGFSVQPSELAKFGLIIAMAALLAGVRDGRPRFFPDVLKMLALMGAAVGLIVAEPDLGTAALIGAVLGGMLLYGGAPIFPLVLSGAALAVPAAYVGFTQFDHLNKRVAEWLGDAGFHTRVSVESIGSGGLFGLGLGQGPAKLAFLPEAHTDFIFAVIGQELGLVGAGATVLLFAGLVWTGLALADACEDRFARVTVFGVTILFGLQAAFNMAVVTGLVPPKGIQLPFVSYGGTGLCVNLALVGLMASASRARTTEPAPRPAASADEPDRPAAAHEIFQRPPAKPRVPVFRPVPVARADDDEQPPRYAS